jgi:hypothetical protein
VNGWDFLCVFNNLLGSFREGVFSGDALFSSSRLASPPVIPIRFAVAPFSPSGLGRWASAVIGLGWLFGSTCRGEGDLVAEENPDGGGTCAWILKRYVAVDGGLLCSHIRSWCHGFGQGDLGRSRVDVRPSSRSRKRSVHSSFKDYGLGEQAVAGALADGVLLSLLGDRASGSGLRWFWRLESVLGVTKSSAAD